MVRQPGRDIQIPNGIICSPNSKRPLTQNGDFFLDEISGARFPIINGVPYLFPEKLLPFVNEGGLDVPLSYQTDPLLQYAMLAQIKGKGGSQNSEPNSIWYQRHIEWATELLETASGTALDIGCDDPAMARSMFPANINYLGLDPVPPVVTRGHFKLLGLAEFLPVLSGSVDAACFLTSLDHVLDYVTAIQEAKRVLREEGQLFLTTLVWSHSAELYHDSVHFHHFREFEVFGALADFRIDFLKRHPWKDPHRSVLYIRASKR
jgi:SAM-dependent methyltransferase